MKHLIKNFKIWNWKRNLRKEAYFHFGVKAPKTWQIRMFIKHYGVHTPHETLQIETNE
jgi:hypothetical protein